MRRWMATFCQRGLACPYHNRSLKDFLELGLALGLGLGFLSSGGRSTPFPVPKMAVSLYSSSSHLQAALVPLAECFKLQDDLKIRCDPTTYTLASCTQSLFSLPWSFTATETQYESKNRDWLHKAQIPPFSNTSNPVATRTTSATGLREPVSTQFKDQHSTPPMCESGFAPVWKCPCARGHNSAGARKYGLICNETKWIQRHLESVATRGDNVYIWSLWWRLSGRCCQIF